MTQLTSSDAGCGICRKLKTASPDSILYENELWHVRAIHPPTGAGLDDADDAPARLGAGPAEFDDREARRGGKGNRGR